MTRTWLDGPRGQETPGITARPGKFTQALQRHQEDDQLGEAQPSHSSRKPTLNPGPSANAR